jgi:hypothetical protein
VNFIGEHSQTEDGPSVLLVDADVIAEHPLVEVSLALALDLDVDENPRLASVPQEDLGELVDEQRPGVPARGGGLATRSVAEDRGVVEVEKAAHLDLGGIVSQPSGRSHPPGVPRIRGFPFPAFSFGPGAGRVKLWPWS